MMKSRSRNAIHMEVFSNRGRGGWPAKIKKGEQAGQRSRGCLLT
jgi:hypothetical protein